MAAEWRRSATTSSCEGRRGRRGQELLDAIRAGDALRVRTLLAADGGSRSTGVDPNYTVIAKFPKRYLP